MKHLNLTPELYNYMLDISLREHPVLTALREETAKLELAVMQVNPAQAQFMQFLLRLINAKDVLEIGTFTGYSALAMALALPSDGKLITCDKNRNWTDIAEGYWKQANQDQKIELKLGLAVESAQSLLDENGPEQFDFIFIDADKTNYINYYELALKLIKPHGIIAIDNIFWDGLVIDPNDTSAQTREIRKLNELIKNDTRVQVSLLAIGDGMFLVQPNSHA